MIYYICYVPYLICIAYPECYITSQNVIYYIAPPVMPDAPCSRHRLWPSVSNQSASSFSVCPAPINHGCPARTSKDKWESAQICEPKLASTGTEAPIVTGTGTTATEQSPRGPLWPCSHERRRGRDMGSPRRLLSESSPSPPQAGEGDGSLLQCRQLGARQRSLPCPACPSASTQAKLRRELRQGTAEPWPQLVTNDSGRLRRTGRPGPGPDPPRCLGARLLASSIQCGGTQRRFATLRQRRRQAHLTVKVTVHFWAGRWVLSADLQGQRFDYPIFFCSGGVPLWYESSFDFSVRRFKRTISPTEARGEAKVHVLTGRVRFGTHRLTSLAVTRSSSLARGHDSPAAGTPHPTPRGKRLGTVPARGQQPATMHSFAGCKPAVRASPSSGSSRRSRRRAAARSSPGRLYLVTADRALADSDTDTSLRFNRPC